MTSERIDTGVRRAGAADLMDVARAFGEASFDEAVFSWVIPDSELRRQRIETGVEELAGWLGGVLETGEILVVGDETRAVAGVSLWEQVTGPPEFSEEAAAEAQEFLVRSYGEHAPRMARVFELTGERHPYDEPHLFLQTIVVVPEFRGRGLGGALLRERLAEVDAEGLPVYLEASTPRNRALYLRHGFVDRGEPIRLPENGPALQPMWRPKGGTSS